MGCPAAPRSRRDAYAGALTTHRAARYRFIHQDSVPFIRTQAKPTDWQRRRLTASLMVRVESFSRGDGCEDWSFVGRRYRPRGRAGMRKGDEGGGVAFGTEHRLAALADRARRARGAWRYATGGNRAGLAQARRMGAGSDRPRQLSTQ